MRVYLTGFMASGKSTVGRRLAKEVGFGFVDLDDEIQAERGQSIVEIFRDEGEAAFRKYESDALRETESLQAFVIAVGGGGLVDDENMTWALKHGLVVFLDPPVDELARRLRRSRTRRPLVESMRDSREELKRYVAGLLGERRPAYERAHVVFRPSRGSVYANARSLAKRLQPLLGPEGTDSSD